MAKEYIVIDSSRIAELVLSLFEFSRIPGVEVIGRIDNEVTIHYADIPFQITVTSE